MEYLRARGRVLDGPGARAGRAARAGPAARRQGLRGVRRRLGHAVGLDHHGLRPPAAQPGARPRHRLAGGPDRLRRGPHLRARADHRRGEDLRARGPALHAGRRRPAAHYAESTSGQVLQEGITEAGALATFIALATAYATWGQPMLPGLPLLFDVRVPAGGRPGLGARRHPGPGHPGRLHGRAHHPAGRGPPARRRAFAPARLDQPGRHGLRRLLRLRGGRHHGGGHRRDAGRRAPGPLLVPDPLQRDLPHAAAARGRGGRGRPPGHHRRRSTASPPAPEVAGRPAGPLCFSGPMWSVAMEAQRILAERWGVAADTWAVTSWTRLRTDALEVERWNRLHPGPSPAPPRDRRHWARAPTPWSPSPTTCARVPDQVARFVDRPYTSLGTDGFGRSDARDGVCARTSRSTRPTCGGRPAAARPGAAAARAGPWSRRPSTTRHRTRTRRRPVHDREHAPRRWPGPLRHRRAPERQRARVGRRGRPTTSKKAQHCFSRWPSDCRAPRARHPSRRRTRRTDRGVGARPSRPTRPPAPATPPPGPRALRRRGCRRSGPASRRRRHRRRLPPSTSRVSSIWPRCWNSSSRRWTSTAPLPRCRAPGRRDRDALGRRGHRVEPHDVLAQPAAGLLGRAAAGSATSPWAMNSAARSRWTARSATVPHPSTP